MRYSQLRFKPAIQFVLFLTTVGLLGFFAEVGQWVGFWSALVLASVIHLILAYLDSSSFSSRLAELRRQEFRLATAFERVGATELFLMVDRRQQLDRNQVTQTILAEGNRFGLATLTAASYIDPAVDRHWPALQARLVAGCPLRLLLQDPLCPEKQVRDLRNKPEGSPDHKLDLHAAIMLVERFPNVQVRLASVNIYAAVFFSERRLTYDPYHLGKNGPRSENRFITIVYEDVRADADPAVNHYGLLVSHFEYLWDEFGRDLRAYLESNRDGLAGICSPATMTEVNAFLARARRP